MFYLIYNKHYLVALKPQWCIGQPLIKDMKQYTILKEFNSIVKDSVIVFQRSNKYPVLNPIFEGEDGKLYKNDKGELIWEHYGEDFEVKDLSLDEFELLFELLFCNKAITFEEYSHLVSCLV